jgi:hypothetical protein
MDPDPDPEVNFEKVYYKMLPPGAYKKWLRRKMVRNVYGIQYRYYLLWNEDDDFSCPLTKQEIEAASCNPMSELFSKYLSLLHALSRQMREDVGHDAAAKWLFSP